MLDRFVVRAAFTLLGCVAAACASSSQGTGSNPPAYCSTLSGCAQYQVCCYQGTQNCYYADESGNQIPQLPPYCTASGDDGGSVVDSGARDTSVGMDAAADVVASFPPSGFVGTWALGTGGGTQTCANGMTTQLVLDPTTITITQNNPSSIQLTASNANPNDFTSAMLAVNGTMASAMNLYGCFGESACDTLTLTYDASAGYGSPDGGDAGGDAGLVPLALDMSISASYNTSSTNCSYSFSYVLNRQ
jgi:hypothetical protein